MEDRPPTPKGSTSTRPAPAPGGTRPLPRSSGADTPARPAFDAAPAVPAAPAAPAARTRRPSAMERARGAVRRPEPDARPPRLRDSVDLLVALALVAVATTARLLPEENTMRLLLTLPVLLFVPGYLLIQMFVPAARTRRDRTVHALIAAGASPAVIGLLALTTATVPGGFRPTPIVVAVTGACVLFAVVAYLRRWLLPAGPGTADAVTA